MVYPVADAKSMLGDTTGRLANHVFATSRAVFGEFRSGRLTTDRFFGFLVVRVTRIASARDGSRAGTRSSRDTTRIALASATLTSLCAVSRKSRKAHSARHLGKRFVRSAILPGYPSVRSRRFFVDAGGGIRVSDEGSAARTWERAVTMHARSPTRRRRSLPPRNRSRIAPAPAGRDGRPTTTNGSRSLDYGHWTGPSFRRDGRSQERPSRGNGRSGAPSARIRRVAHRQG